MKQTGAAGQKGKKMEKELEVTLTVKVKAVLEDSEATKQTVRFLIEEDLRDRGWDADVYVRNAEPVRHGKWRRDEFGARCGACGLYAYRDKFDQPFESLYCPNCGAKMDAERKEE